MLALIKSANAWGSPAFDQEFKCEVSQLKIEQLPLQQGLSYSSVVADSEPKVVILSRVEQGGTIKVKAGVFYYGIVAGCSCADDPTPTNEITEYCEVMFTIDKKSAITTAVLAD